MTRLPDAPWRHRAGMDRLLAALDAKSGATRCWRSSRATSIWRRG
jgi:hypothetical protein